MERKSKMRFKTVPFIIAALVLVGYTTGKGHGGNAQVHMDVPTEEKIAES